MGPLGGGVGWLVLAEPSKKLGFLTECCKFSQFPSKSHKFWMVFTWVFPKIVGFPPKSSISIGFSIINHSILGVLPLFETPTCIYHNRWLQKVASCTVVVTLSGTWHIIPLRRTPRNCRFTSGGIASFSPSRMKGPPPGVRRRHFSGGLRVAAIITVIKTLVGYFVLRIILPSCMGIIPSHYN